MYTIGMNAVSSHTSELGFIEKIVSWTSHLILKIQDSIAKVFKMKNSDTLNKTLLIWGVVVSWVTYILSWSWPIVGKYLSLLWLGWMAVDTGLKALDKEKKSN